MATQVDITFREQDIFEVKVPATGVTLAIDKSQEGHLSGGANPLELFLASLAGCIGVYAKRYLTMHSIAFTDLRISASADMAQDSPARLVNIKVVVSTDAKIDNREVFMRFIHNCPVHNTLLHTKEVEISLAQK